MYLLYSGCPGLGELCSGTCKRPGNLVPPRFNNQTGDHAWSEFSLSPERYEATHTSRSLYASQQPITGLSQ